MQFMTIFKGSSGAVEWESKRMDTDEDPVHVRMQLKGFELLLSLNGVTTIVAVPGEAADALFIMFAGLSTGAELVRTVATLVPAGDAQPLAVQ